MGKELFDLNGKVALVIGGRGTIGRRFCSAFHDYGAQVYSADLAHPTTTSSSFAALSEIAQRDVDVTDPDSVDRLVSDILETQARIDILVSSVTAKCDDFYKPFTECSLSGWQTVLNTELNGVFLVAQRVGRAMEERKQGSMIFMSSIYGVVGNDQRIYEGSNLDELYQKEKGKRVYSHAVYAAAKGGIIALTRFLAAYWGDKNIRVNCISPGGLTHPGENAEFVKRYSERVPLGRKAGVDEITGAAVFLASDASTYVTGHNLVVDGGWTIW
jgi:NAD(P)-dependent dehydrogenase (short-subunit alcohol dehydrogenase family)